MAPGTAVRQSLFAAPPDPLRLIEIAAATAGAFFDGAVSTHPLTLLGVAAVAVGLGASGATRLAGQPTRGGAVRAAALVPAAALLIVAGFAPSAYAFSGPPGAHTMLIPTFVLIVAAFASAYACGALLAPSQTLRRGLAAASVVCLVASAGVFAAEAWPRRIDMRAASVEWDAVDARIRRERADGAAAVRVVVPRRWASLDEIGPDASFWVNACASRYYGVSVLGEPAIQGPGRK